MAGKIEENWTMERVGVKEPPFYLPKDMDIVTMGRRARTNYRHCNGVNVSRNHLKFVKEKTLDSGKVTWCVRDLGTVAGTFVNGVQIQPRTSYSLKSGDYIGLGCPLKRSVKEVGFEAFVYQIYGPEIEEKGLDNLDNRNLVSILIEVITDRVMRTISNMTPS